MKQASQKFKHYFLMLIWINNNAAQSASSPMRQHFYVIKQEGVHETCLINDTLERTSEGGKFVVKTVSALDCV